MYQEVNRMDERHPAEAEDGAIVPGEPDEDAGAGLDAEEEGPDDFLDQAGEAIADPYNLRLTALLHQMVRKRGHRRAAKALGVDRRTVAASVREGLSRRVRDALERVLVEQDGDARDRLEEDLTEVREQLGDLTQELRDGFQAAQGRTEALEQRQAEGMRRMEARLTLAEAARYGSPADAPGRRPGPGSGSRHRYPDLVTTDPAGDDEAVFGEAWPLVQEWRRLWRGHPAQGRGLEWVSTRARVLELEVELLEERGMTLPPETEPLRGLDRAAQLNWRRKALADIRRKRARLELLRRLRRPLSPWSWRR